MPRVRSPPASNKRNPPRTPSSGEPYAPLLTCRRCTACAVASVQFSSSGLYPPLQLAAIRNRSRGKPVSHYPPRIVFRTLFFPSLPLTHHLTLSRHLHFRSLPF